MPADARPTLLEIAEEVATLGAGLTAALMPLLLLSMPALAPLAVFIGVVVAVLGVAAAVLVTAIGVPLLVVRMLVRRLGHRAPAEADA